MLTWARSLRLNLPPYLLPSPFYSAAISFRFQPGREAVRVVQRPQRQTAVLREGHHIYTREERNARDGFRGPKHPAGDEIKLVDVAEHAPGDAPVRSKKSGRSIGNPPGRLTIQVRFGVGWIGLGWLGGTWGRTNSGRGWGGGWGDCSCRGATQHDQLLQERLSVHLTNSCDIRRDNPFRV